MERKRDILQTNPTFILSRGYDPSSHADPVKRGGYLLITPGRLPEIVLDGMASADEQHAAERRCMRELERNLYQAQISGHDQEQQRRRRSVVRMSAELVVTEDQDPVAHADPSRRGAYLIKVEGRVPEIVLDGLAPESEQRAAEARCLAELNRKQTSRNGRSADSVGRLKELLAHKRPPAPELSRNTPSRLGELLVRRGMVRGEDLQRTLALQERLPEDQPVRRIGSLLVEQGHLSLSQLAGELGVLRGVSACTGTVTRVDVALRNLFPFEGLRELEAAPLFLAGRTLAIAMCDPQRKESVATLQALTPYQLQPMQAPQLQVHKLLASLKRS